MRFLTLGEVVELHQRLLTQSGGASGIRDLGLLESALAQPKATFAGKLMFGRVGCTTITRHANS